MAATTTLRDSEAFPWFRDEPPADASSQRTAFSFEYPVHFTSDLFSWENLTLVRAISRREPRRCHRMTVVVDRAVADAHPCLVDDVARYGAFHRERLMLAADVLVLDGGESAKTERTLSELHAFFHTANLDAQSFVVIVGGGALQDVVGYAAATAQRGPRVVRVPTTVLAQATAPAVIKSGIHGDGKKHFFGTFVPPFAVIDDFDFLETLSPRDTRAGMAEAMRVGLAADPALFGWLRLHATALAGCERTVTRELVRKVARHHLARGADPFDLPIVLGQWAAHRLEEITDHELRYGEAIAIGCALDAVHSAACGVLDSDALEPIVSTLQALGLPTYHPALDAEVDGRRILLDGLRRVSVLERIGCAVEASEFDEETILRAVDWLRHRG